MMYWNLELKTVTFASVDDKSVEDKIEPGRWEIIKKMIAQCSQAIIILNSFYCLGASGALNHNVLDGHILVTLAVSCCHLFDFINHIHSGSHFAENTVTPATASRGCMVKKIIVSYIDEELAACRVWC